MRREGVKLQAVEQALLVLLADLLQALAEFFELGIAGVLLESGDEFDLHLASFLGRVGVFEDTVEHVGIEHEGLDVVAHGFDVDVLVDEFDGLRAEAMPEQTTVSADGLYGFIDLRQPFEVLGIGAQAGIRRKRLPDGAEHAVFRGELVPRGVVRQALLRGHQAFIAADAAVHVGEEGQALQHLHGQCLA